MIRSLIIFSILSFSGAYAHAQNALNFDGSNDFVQTTSPGVTGSSNRTFEAWINVDANHTGNSCILDYGRNAVGSRNTFLVSGTNQLGFISGGTNANLFSSANAVPTNQWVHVAFVLNNSTGYLYVNGSQVTSGNLSTVNTPSTSITNIRIGQRVSGGSIPFDGSIDELRVWNVVRTASELSTNSSAEFCTQDSRLVAYHKFNHGTAAGTNTGVTSSTDYSSNNNNGTLNNFSLTGSGSNWVAGRTLTRSTQFGNDTISSCNSYTGPSGNQNWTSSGQFTDTILSQMGCDSVVTVSLTIRDTTHGYISASACSSYTSPSGNFVWTTSGIHTDTLVNSNSCDSILFVDLSINQSFVFIMETACDNYTSPSGNYLWSTTGVYEDTLTNSFGCDSVVRIGLTILNNFSQISETSCATYTSPSGNYNWSVDGTYYDTLSNSFGCDSVLEILLDITGPSSANLNISRCVDYTSPSGAYTWNQTGVYQDTIVNNAGCDSVLTIDLVIGFSSSTQNVVSCDSFRIPGSGMLVTMSGTYPDSLIGSNGCDSVINYQVTIDSIDNSIQRNVDQLEALQAGANYQWFSCIDGVLDTIVLDTARVFEPNENGAFACVISDGSCVDTSECFDVNWLGQVNQIQEKPISLFPNPNQGSFQIKIPGTHHLASLEVINVHGQIVFSSSEIKGELIQLDLKLKPGLYSLRLLSSDYVSFKEFVVE